MKLFWAMLIRKEKERDSYGQNKCDLFLRVGVTSHYPTSLFGIKLNKQTQSNIPTKISLH